MSHVAVHVLVSDTAPTKSLQRKREPKELEARVRATQPGSQAARLSWCVHSFCLVSDPLLVMLFAFHKRLVSILLRL